ncbi:hypothetical protein HFO42_19720 [Rhizobium leguminosarum]|uniref:Uncharacterized protein n=1 Tax=Rhizobium leguminosarum TaxID=384 RepID=A0AAJ1AAQ7_RHILE|nr:hypothetical protein [Rhizobium leguminosarum]MBY5535919.1 hypothetical protein [Rhizobium leguminosarum]MBY5597276.1 hypothetical protein [Rhizobium leguminosarum]MBY5617273.1 hypothetical protein [Rhizobium leguminosarum]MBY5630318.1 hypothetical protein [Rhizobium leguminosarum]MBY5732672.1 hypothetical protein [Rhizobium leguminosarum]
MKRLVALAFIAVASVGCETAKTARTYVDVETLPEYGAHQRCLGRQTAIYSKAAGSPLELGIIASAACNSTRYALETAIAKVNGPVYAHAFTGTLEKQEATMIAGVIAKVKAGQDPF